jgi:hypothetical protein
MTLSYGFTLKILPAKCGTTIYELDAVGTLDGSGIRTILFRSAIFLKGNVGALSTVFEVRART